MRFGTFFFFQAAPGLTREELGFDQIRRSMELFAREVMPRFRA